MWLVGKLDVENKLFDDTGMVGRTMLSFILPHRLRRRHKLKVRYFGFHSGMSEDNPKKNGLKEVNVGDTATLVFFQHRHPVAEMRLRVKANGDDIMHDNTSSHFVDRKNTIQNTDYISYPTTKVGMALMNTGIAAVDNDWSLPLPTGFGSSTMQNLTIGHVEENASQIDVILEAVAYETEGNANTSSEPNVRMDSVTVVLQLV